MSFIQELRDELVADERHEVRVANGGVLQLGHLEPLERHIWHAGILDQLALHGLVLLEFLDVHV